MPPPNTSEMPPRTRVVPVLVLQCFVVLACVLITTAIAAAVQERSIRSSTEERVLDVSQSLAGLDQVREALRLDVAEATASLQPLADLIEQASGVDYVVITDADGVRITHPTPAERGRLVSTDPTGVLAGETFVGTETGTLGPTLRAKVPVVVDGVVIGTASVGILESDIVADYEGAVWSMIPWVVVSVVAGCLVSGGVIALVGRRIRRLEAEARQTETQRRIADALREQTHEFRTRVHVIRGLVAEGDDTAALDYMARIVPVTTDEGAGIDIADPAVRSVIAAEAQTMSDDGGVLEIDPFTSVPRGALSDLDVSIVANLCRNAVEAARERVRILVAIDGDRLRIEVDDDGAGVPTEARARIFDRGVSSKGAGRGVGLDLIRRETAARGGTITVGRSPWGGARFVVEVPVATVGASS